MVESAGWREDSISDKVRLPVKKVIDILGDTASLEFGLDTKVDVNSEILLGLSSLETEEYEPERVIVGCLLGRNWHVICASSRDTTSEEDRTFSNLELLMMADGIPCR